MKIIKEFYFHSGQHGLPRNHRELADVGINLFHIQIVPQIRYKFNPYKGTKEWQHNFGGWNENCFDEIQKILNQLSGGCKLAIVIDGSPRRRNHRESKQWDMHLFNARNGGMIEANNGVSAFYTNKYSQEMIVSLIHEIVERFKKYDVLIAFNWEIFNGFRSGGGDLAAQLAREFSKNVHFGIGTPIRWQNKYVKELSGKNIFSILEGATPRGWRNEYAGKRPPFEAISFGYWANEIERYENKDDASKAAYMQSDRWRFNTADIIESIALGWKWGYQMGLPFEQKMKRTPYLKEIGADLDYPFQKQNEALFSYLRYAIDAYKKGQKRRLKKITNQYLRELRS